MVDIVLMSQLLAPFQRTRPSCWSGMSTSCRCRSRICPGRHHCLRAMPTVRLTEIFRQAATSQIIVNAHRINQGQMPLMREEGQSDFYVMRQTVLKRSRPSSSGRDGTYPAAFWAPPDSRCASAHADEPWEPWCSCLNAVLQQA